MDDDPSSDAERARVAQFPRDRAEALYRAVRLGAPGYQRSDVTRLAGIEHERSVRWWRAMGLPEVPEDLPAFTELDVEMVKRLASLTGAGLVDDAAVLRLARLLGVSFSRVAEAQVGTVEELLEALPARAPGPTAEYTDALVAGVDSVFELLEESLVYVWRRQLFAALGRRLQADESADEQAVGFADLSGFTKLTQRVGVDRLGEIIDEFEKTAFDVVSVHGGRAVKFVGDELMFVADTLPVAVDIGLDLAERLRAIEDMPPIHCGIANGPTVAVGGDVFGPAVNLAARLTAFARRGTVVIPRAASTQLAGRDDIELVRVRRTFAFKGIGDTRVVIVRRRATTASG